MWQWGETKAEGDEGGRGVARVELREGLGASGLGWRGSVVEVG